MMDDACGGINAAIRRSGTTCHEQGKRENMPYSLFINFSYPTLGKQWKQCQILFLGAPKSLQIVIAAMKLKDAYSLEGKL